MTRVTIEMLRRKAEHNDGALRTLEEVALHQCELEKIEVVQDVCRELRIVLMQGNAIAKIENVRKLKALEYLNLAMNRITMIENLEGCESLQKLDLTMNAIGIRGLLSVAALTVNDRLRELFLMGNPCADHEGYRSFVIAAVPQLKFLDGAGVTPLERITARHNYLRIKREFEDIVANEGKTSDEGDAHEAELQSTGEHVEPALNEKLNTSHSQGEARDIPRTNIFDALPEDVADVKQKNQGEFAFTLTESEDESALELEVRVGTFMDTSLIHVDIQPRLVRVKIKGDLLQLRLSHEVATDASVAERSKSTGKLLITMPKVNWHVKPRRQKLLEKAVKTSDPLATISYCSDEISEPPDIL